jgi:hypothetical protein
MNLLSGCFKKASTPETSQEREETSDKSRLPLRRRPPYTATNGGHPVSCKACDRPNKYSRERIGLNAARCARSSDLLRSSSTSAVTSDSRPSPLGAIFRSVPVSLLVVSSPPSFGLHPSLSSPHPPTDTAGAYSSTPPMPMRSTITRKHSCDGRSCDPRMRHIVRY